MAEMTAPVEVFVGNAAPESTNTAANQNQVDPAMTLGQEPTMESNEQFCSPMEALIAKVDESLLFVSDSLQDVEQDVEPASPAVYGIRQTNLDVRLSGIALTSHMAH